MADIINVAHEEDCEDAEVKGVDILVRQLTKQITKVGRGMGAFKAGTIKD